MTLTFVVGLRVLYSDFALKFVYFYNGFAMKLYVSFKIVSRIEV